MVVCKCRKATRLYCFVHKVPVCGECICFLEHQFCVVKKYSDWVVDAEYDWPTTCSVCQAALEDTSSSRTTRLGCLHLMHTECLVSHIQSFPPHTAPAGYVCPGCSTPIWPPKSMKDTGSRLHSKLKEGIILSGMEKNVFGDHLVTLPAAETRTNNMPPAFASIPLVSLPAVHIGEQGSTSSFGSINDPNLPSSSVNKEENYPAQVFASAVGTSLSIVSEPDIVEIDGPGLGNHFTSNQDAGSTSPVGPGATTRKGTYHVDRQNSEISYYDDDEDGGHKKYTRRGPFHHKFLRRLLPFWSNPLPTLPVTAPLRKDGHSKEDAPEGRTRRHRSSRMDPRKILLSMAILACMATMGILYYRLAQRGLGQNMLEGEPQ